MNQVSKRSATRVVADKSTSYKTLMDDVNRRIQRLESAGSTISNVQIVYDGKYIGVITYIKPNEYIEVV